MFGLSWVLVLGVLGWSPVAEAADPVGTARFLGYSLESVRGDAGLGELSAACHARFPQSRVCLEEEVFNAGPAEAAAEEGWVLARGLLTPGGSSCYHPRTGFFTETGGNGTVVTAEGNFARRACIETLPVACCGR